MSEETMLRDLFDRWERVWPGLVNAKALTMSYPGDGRPGSLISAACRGRVSPLTRQTGLAPLRQGEAISCL